MVNASLVSPNKFIDSFVEIASTQFKAIWLDIKNIFSFFNSDVIFIIKVFLLAFSFILLIAILILIKKTGYWTEIIFDDFTAFVAGEKKGKKDKQETWLKIEKLAKAKNKESLKLALIKADNLLEKIIKERGFEIGEFEENLADLVREENVPEIFNDIKKAHYFKQNIELDEKNEFSLEQAQTFLEVYRQLFRKLNYIK